ncbi:MAG: DUF2752 domain-containing protein [Lachnospiraceae bacterium]|nr:DUF2752 domain-containing protein [Lachnospiraceae bacterium]
MLDKLLTYLKLKKKDILSACASILAVALLYLFFHLVGIGCPIHFLTGVSCPVCGMTRAAISVARFHFADAFHYHPLVYLLPFALLTFLLRHRIPKKFYRILIFTFIMFFVTIYIVRMCDPTNDIVEFHPEQGFIFRTINKLFT